MKFKFLTLACLVFIGKTIAQDTNLYQTWYLYQLEADLEGVVWDIEVAQPQFSPQLTISSDLTFNGIGACNGFSGYYTYDVNQNSLFPNSVYFTLGNCDTNEEYVFENLYFPYVDANTNHTITLTTIGNLMELKLENFPGYVAIYRNVSLSVADDYLVQLSVYPNPIIDEINILYHGSQTLSATIYDVNGKLVFHDEDIKSSINTSELSKGIYFLELTTGREKTIRKFVKN